MSESRRRIEELQGRAEGLWAQLASIHALVTVMYREEQDRPAPIPPVGGWGGDGAWDSPIGAVEKGLREALSRAGALTCDLDPSELLSPMPDLGKAVAA